MKMPGRVNLFLFLIVALFLSAEEKPSSFPSVFDAPVPECDCSALVNEVNVHRAISIYEWQTRLDGKKGWLESGMEYVDAFHADVTQKVHVLSANADVQILSWSGGKTKKKRHRIPRDGNASEGISGYFNRLFHDDTFLSGTHHSHPFGSLHRRRGEGLHRAQGFQRGHLR